MGYVNKVTYFVFNLKTESLKASFEFSNRNHAILIEFV